MRTPDTKRKLGDPMLNPACAPWLLIVRTSTFKIR